MSHLPPPNVYKKDGVWTVDGRPRESLLPLSRATPSNTPGFTLISTLITLPPRGALPPHTHSGAAVTGNIISGRVLNQMNDDEPAYYGDGEGEERGWYESPGCHHVRNENPSEEREAVFVAVFLVRTEILEEVGMEGLVLLDAVREERARGREQVVGNQGMEHAPGDEKIKEEHGRQNGDKKDAVKENGEKKDQVKQNGEARSNVIDRFLRQCRSWVGGSSLKTR